MALGRGLSSLIPNQSAPSKQRATTVPVQSTVAPSTPITHGFSSNVEVLNIPLAAIEPNPDQPRLQFDPQAIQQLADSIEQHGLLEPIIVTPTTTAGAYYIVAGERRYRAFKHLQRTTIPAIVRTTSELERLELALIENIQRENLNPIERAKSYRRLIDEFGLTQDVAAKKMGIARSSLANVLRLLELPPVIQLGLTRGTLSEGHAKVLLGLPTDAERLALYEQLLQTPKLSVRKLTESIQQRKPITNPSVNHEWVALAAEVQRALGTKVRIQPRMGGGGQIIIQTYSAEELQGVIKKMTARSS
jgi:ParB family chromosome partitioning protein